ncbi:MAG: biotin--[acetyl-CoA-carboxylase] ligase [Eubacteriales bacterium]|nr:biotin--[acetyl-CoA-carboxylase] ligase [Eubacteriales bacterium]
MLKAKVLHELRNSSDYVSGQWLCHRFNVSRTAIWKCINQLKEDGYAIEAVNNKGYRITAYPDVITESEIESLLIDRRGIVSKLVYFEETDSTNNEAKKHAETGVKNAPDGTLFITECQTGGRGRRGRGWESPAGSGIWMSLLLRPSINPNNASMLTLVTALAVARTVFLVTGSRGCKIKWPNDIVLNKKKICGILTEMSAETDFIHYVVIGIGINVNTAEFDDDIKDKASSLYMETKVHVKRSEIVAVFSSEFKKYYEIFLETKDMSGLIDDYNSMLINAGREVSIISADEEYTGTASGINQKGELLVTRDDGSRVEICAGEVSVRGLYGYV